MAYVILLLTVIVYFIRPAEWIPALYFNWNMLLNGLGLLALMGIIFRGGDNLKFQRPSLFLIAFILAMFVSNIMNFQFGTISTYFSQMLTVLLIFMLADKSITKPGQIDTLIFSIILTILFICFQCYLQFTTGYNWGGLDPLYRVVGYVGDEIIREPQVRWYGILQDPNDLGMFLVAFMPYIFSKIFYQELLFPRKLLWAVILMVILYTIILTNSRGTILAFMGSIAFFYIIKKRSMTGYVMAGIVCLGILAIAPSRMAELGSGDYSAMGRVFAWILALELFAMNPVFGVGAYHWLDYHGLTTHNSYVLAFVENGSLGFYFYIGLIANSLYTMVNVTHKIVDKKQKYETLALVSGMVGILVSMFFISRTYVLLPFLYTAIMMSYIKVNQPDLYNEFVSKLSKIKIFVIMICFIVFVYVFNRLSTMFLL